MLGVIKRSIGNDNLHVFSSLCKSLVRPILECAAPIWSPYPICWFHNTQLQHLHIVDPCMIKEIASFVDYFEHAQGKVNFTVLSFALPQFSTQGLEIVNGRKKNPAIVLITYALYPRMWTITSCLLHSFEAEKELMLSQMSILCWTKIGD